MNKALREEILVPYLHDVEFGGVRKFSQLPLNVLEKLIKNRFVELGPWNNCDGVTALFLPFLKRHPDFTPHGYVVNWDREDTRITIEGVEKDAQLAIHEIIDFANTFRAADEFQLSEDHACCWYY